MDKKKYMCLFCGDCVGPAQAVLRMLEAIEHVDNVPQFIEDVKNRKRKLMGFGHRVYKNYDPRARIVKSIADEVFSILGKDPLIDVAIALEQVALNDPYFIKRKVFCATGSSFSEGSSLYAVCLMVFMPMVSVACRAVPRAMPSCTPTWTSILA